MWKKYVVMLFNYSPFHNKYILRWQTASFTTITGCSLWGANWISYRLTNLKSVNDTRTSSIVIIPWYQTGSNNTNKTHLLGFSIVQFLRKLIIQKCNQYPLQIWPQLRPYIKSESLHKAYSCSMTICVGHLWAYRDRPPFTVWTVECLVAQNI